MTEISNGIARLTGFLEEKEGAWPYRELLRRFGHQVLESARLTGATKQIRQLVAYLPGTPRENIVARTHRGQLTCVSALAKWGIATLNHPQHWHVGVARNNHRVHTRDTILHRLPDTGLRAAATENVITNDSASAVLCALRCLPTLLEREVLVDSVINQQLMTKPQLIEMLRAQERRQPAEVWQAVLFGDGRARSPLETIARHQVIRDLHLQAEPGVIIPQVGEVDMLISDGIHEVLVELDGFEWHSDQAQFRKDRKRDRMAVTDGWTTLRFTWDDVKDGVFSDYMRDYFHIMDT